MKCKLYFLLEKESIDKFKAVSRNFSLKFYLTFLRVIIVFFLLID